jgi:hypothetical protein
MIKKVYLEEIKHESRTSKAGKPYTTCAIKVDGRWRNGLGNKVTLGWQKGMNILVDLFQEEYNGTMYDKFKIVTDLDLLTIRVKALEDKVFPKQAKSNVDEVFDEPPSDLPWE